MRGCYLWTIGIERMYLQSAGKGVVPKMIEMLGMSQDKAISRQH